MLNNNNNNKQNRNRLNSNQNDARLVGFKKRQENICPVEYESCWCDYTNTNSNLNTNANSLNNDQTDSKSGSASSSSSVTTFALKLSIMIDCQYYLINEQSTENLKLNKTNRKKQILTEIPKISNSQSGSKFKYLNMITHLDLSRTAITEIGTDAFQVSLTMKKCRKK